MRTKKSIQNIITSLIMGLALIIINFIAQKFLVDILGVEYAGLNSLLINVVSMLAITELGIGSAIIFHLYDPLHKKDIKLISSIMRFYRTSYRVIASIILFLGLVVMPFLPIIIGNSSISVNIYIVFLLFVINSAASYLLSYKRSLLYADQKNYIISVVHLGSLAILSAAQIAILILTKNYYLYLIIKIIMTVVENLVINYIVNKQYKLDFNAKPISKKLQIDIFTKMKGLLYHKIAYVVSSGSTNVVLSTLLGLTAVGMYSNYLLIQTALYALFAQVSDALRASVGNLLVAEPKKKRLLIFNRLQFAGQALAIVSTSVFLVASGSFVNVWLGDKYVFSVGVVVALSVNIYLHLIRGVAFHNFKEASGIFYEDRFVPVIELIVNVVASIVGVKLFGMAGAFIGVSISLLVLHLYSYPKFVYNGVLGRTYKEYATRMLKEVLVALVAIGAAYFVSLSIGAGHGVAGLLVNVSIGVIVPTVILWAIYSRSSEYKYYVGLVKGLMKR